MSNIAEVEVTRPANVIENYRIEKISNGFVVHKTSGKDGPVTKLAFLDKVELLAYFQKVL